MWSLANTLRNHWAKVKMQCLKHHTLTWHKCPVLMSVSDHVLSKVQCSSSSWYDTWLTCGECVSVCSLNLILLQCCIRGGGRIACRAKETLQHSQLKEKVDFSAIINPQHSLRNEQTLLWIFSYETTTKFRFIILECIHTWWLLM